jgi:hypothetical protein
LGGQVGKSPTQVCRHAVADSGGELCEAVHVGVFLVVS